MSSQPPRQYAPDEVNQYGDYIKIGGSPVPGLTLRHVLRGHTGAINRIAWSPDGKYLASPSEDKTIRIWDGSTGECVKIFNDDSAVSFVAWSPNGHTILTESNQICVWDINTLKQVKTIKYSTIKRDTLRWLNNDVVLFEEVNKIKFFNLVSNKVINELDGQSVLSLAISKDKEFFATGGIYGDNSIRVWNLESGKIISTLRGHKNNIYSLAWFQNNDFLASGSADHTIRIWNISSQKETLILEGHSDIISSIAISSDGELLASLDWDGNTILWNPKNGSLITHIRTRTSTGKRENCSLAFHPTKQILCTPGEGNIALNVWELDSSILNNVTVLGSTRYTTAKLVLVGDSGVGKTGLGWRLAHGEFKEHASTHGQQFWAIPQLGQKRPDGVECEAVLWDLAGQPDYRLIHSLYLDDVDLAMILFDPTNRQQPLAGVDFWLNQLKRKDKDLCNTILVGARTDRGISTLTDDEIRAYCERNGICGGYIPTSALNGEGLPELLEQIKAQIPWDEMTATVTTVTFKRIKEFVLELKENPERKNVLVSPAELRKLLEATTVDDGQENVNGQPSTAWAFTDAEMMTAVGHLETYGYVKLLHSSNGLHSILLAPDLLVNLASSIILEARRNPRGLGVLEEARLLRGEYPFPELNQISADEGKILLDAAAVLFLEHNLCFRETFNRQAFLVFPSLINEKRPQDENAKTTEGASYRVKGPVENLYASLVVLLGYTNTFVRTHQWQNQAQYEMGEGEICGFQQFDQGDGSTEFVLYYGLDTPEPVQLMFRGLFERFLSRRELEISRYQVVNCQKCGSQLARNVVVELLSGGNHFSFCHKCGKKVTLPDPQPLTRLSQKEAVVVDAQQAVVQYRTAFEAALVRVKGLLRDRGDGEKSPSCFISYAWGVPEHERWTQQLAKDLRNAGIGVLFDRWDNPPGSDIGRFIVKITASDFVVVVGTPKLKEKYLSETADPVVSAELELIDLRARKPNQYGRTILPALLAGDARTSLPPMLEKLVHVDFRDEKLYFRQLFDMIWRLYDLPFDNPLLEELQASMTPQNNS